VFLISYHSYVHTLSLLNNFAKGSKVFRHTKFINGVLLNFIFTIFSDYLSFIINMQSHVDRNADITVSCAAVGERCVQSSFTCVSFCCTFVCTVLLGEYILFHWEGKGRNRKSRDTLTS